jgi:CBS domain-containing protein
VRQAGHLPGAALLDGAPGTALIELAERHGVLDAVVVDVDGRYRGTITARELQSALLNREALALTTAADLMRTDVPSTHEDESMEVAFQKLTAKDVDAIPVVERGTRRLLGVLTRERLMQAYSDEMARDA